MTASPLPRVLMIDIGGSNVKVMLTNNPEMRKFPSGRTLTAQAMVEGVKSLVKDWVYDCVTLGFPGLVKDGKLLREPLNLSGGWLNYDFSAAFARPLRIINDAALQALANYTPGRMLFVGFGTSVGAALIADDVIVPVELGLVPFGKKHRFMTTLTKEARRNLGQQRWHEYACSAITLLQDMFWPTNTVIGGGNAKNLEPLPPNCIRTTNREAIRGAIRLWDGADIHAKAYGTTWRISQRTEP